VEAERVSKILGVPVLAASALPATKSKFVQSLQNKGNKVAMIGDGINDAPSLATADVGIMISRGRTSLTAGGSVLIQNSNLESLLHLFYITEQTVKQMKINTVWALSYNIVALVLACGAIEPWGYKITPTISATMMSLSSVFITLHSLSLKERLVNGLKRSL